MIGDTNWYVCPVCYSTASFLTGLTDANTVTLAPHCANQILFARILKPRRQQRLSERAPEPAEQGLLCPRVGSLSHLLVLPVSPVSPQLIVLGFLLNLVVLMSLVFK